jgi:hypothetical protein
VTTTIERNAMKCIEPGHAYLLAHKNNLHFVKKAVVSVAELLKDDPHTADLPLSPPDATVLITEPGTTNEEVLEVLLDRTRYLNGLFPCPENETAIAGMQQALDAFNARTAKRQAQGVEGKLVAHA